MHLVAQVASLLHSHALSLHHNLPQDLNHISPSSSSSSRDGGRGVGRRGSQQLSTLAADGFAAALAADASGAESTREEREERTREMGLQARSGQASLESPSVPTGDTQLTVHSGGGGSLHAGSASGVAAAVADMLQESLLEGEGGGRRGSRANNVRARVGQRGDAAALVDGEHLLRTAAPARAAGGLARGGVGIPTGMHADVARLVRARMGGAGVETPTVAGAQRGGDERGASSGESQTLVAEGAPRTRRWNRLAEHQVG
jgi:hypothetical protein